MVVGVICVVLALPLETELRVQAAKRHLRRATTVSECISEFENPRTAVSNDSKKILSERLHLSVTSNDQVLTFNKEGLPYWAIYVVTSDGNVVKDWAVDRFW